MRVNFAWKLSNVLGKEVRRYAPLIGERSVEMLSDC